MGHTDFDWGNNEIDGRRKIGGCFILGSSMVSRMSIKQDTIDMSSDEVEYVAVSEVFHEAVCLRKLLSDLFEGLLSPTHIHCDNESYIRLTEDSMFHARKNHINNKYHYIRRLV